MRARSDLEDGGRELGSGLDGLDGGVQDVHGVVLSLRRPSRPSPRVVGNEEEAKHARGLAEELMRV